MNLVRSVDGEGAPAAASLAGWLAVVEAHLPVTLVGRRARAKIWQAAARLPGDCLAALELRLARHAAAVDLSLRVAEPGQALRLAEVFSPDPATPLRRFLSRWAASDELRSRCPYLWLELDLGRRAADPAAPLPDPVLCAKLLGPESARWLEEELLPVLHPRAVGTVRGRLLQRCLGELPPGARPLYLFTLLARGSDALRLELCDLRAADVEPYLRRVVPEAAQRTSGHSLAGRAVRQVAALAWPAVRQAAALLADCDRIHLSIDLMAGPPRPAMSSAATRGAGAAWLSPRIGLEGAYAAQPARDPRWAALAARLVAGGLCTPAKAGSLLSWPGHDTFWSAASAWPLAGSSAAGDLAHVSADRERTAAHDGACVRCLSHFKLICGPLPRPSAKAYLLFGCLPSTRLRAWRTGEDARL